MTSIRETMFGKKNNNNKRFSSGFDVDVSLVTSVIENANLEARQIDFDKLSVSPFNTYGYTQEEIDELVSSIASLGLLDYLIVEIKDVDHYEILSGQKRYLALKQLRTENEQVFQSLFPNDKIPCKVIDLETFTLTGEQNDNTISEETKRVFVIASGNQQHEKTISDFMLQVEQLTKVYQELKEKKLLPVGVRQREFMAEHIALQSRSIQKVINAYRDIDSELWELLKQCPSLNSAVQLETISKLSPSQQLKLKRLLDEMPNANLNNFLKQQTQPSNPSPPVAAINEIPALSSLELGQILRVSKSQSLTNTFSEPIVLTETDMNKLEAIGTKIEKLQLSAEKLLNKYVNSK